MDPILWVNGQLVEAGAPAISADDHALVGDGAFEAIKVIDGRPFAFDRHIQRLIRSAAALDIAVDVDVVTAAARTVLGAAEGTSYRWLRMTVTAGVAPMGTGGRGSVPTVVAATTEMKRWTEFSDVVILPWTRNEGSPTAGLKTTSYADNVIGLRRALALGADEGIFANTKGFLCEGTGSNVVVAINGQLVTPNLEGGCLPGITRNLLIEWLPEIVEAPVPIDALRTAEEAFLTSTSRDVQPIRSVDGHALSSAPGPLSSRAMRTFNDQAPALLGWEVGFRTVDRSAP